MHTLHTIRGWRKAQARSHDAPVLIFKHSSACGTSSRAKRYLDEAMRELGIDGGACIVTVQIARRVSDAIERDTHITHETPQIIMLFKGEPFYFASHSEIQTKDIISKFGELRSLAGEQKGLL